VIPEADGARATALKQLLQNGEDAAMRAAIRASGENATAKSAACPFVKKRTTCDWFRANPPGLDCREELLFVACGGEDDGGDEGDGGGDGGNDGGDDSSGSEPTSPYPDGPRGGDGGDSGGDEDESCDKVNPEPGSDCEPTDQPQEDDVKETELCPDDPLKDMDIRATCDGVKGRRFGENARGEGDAHYGIDLLADPGTSAWALTSGKVYGVNRITEVSDFGKYVIIQSDGKMIMYAHLSKVSVKGG
jgi:hypothetical protein